MQLHYEQHQNKKVSSAKYLGITINSHLTWSNHIGKICNKALSVKAFLQQNLPSCPPNIKLLLHDLYHYDKILPSPVYGHHKLNKTLIK